jgi:hypothetical protein
VIQADTELLDTNKKNSATQVTTILIISDSVFKTVFIILMKCLFLLPDTASLYKKKEIFKFNIDV